MDNKKSTGKRWFGGLLVLSLLSVGLYLFLQHKEEHPLPGKQGPALTKTLPATSPRANVESLPATQKGNVSSSPSKSKTIFAEVKTEEPKGNSSPHVAENHSKTEPT